MSHDRGCPCGRERWEYRECAAAKGEECFKIAVVRMWNEKDRPVAKLTKNEVLRRVVKT